MRIEYTKRFIKDYESITDKRAKKETEKVLNILRSTDNFVDLFKILDIRKYEIGGYRIRYSGKPEWRIRFDVTDDPDDSKKKMLILQLVLPREKYEKYAHTVLNEEYIGKRVRIIITEQQLQLLTNIYN